MAAAGGGVEFLDHGAVVVRGALTREEQCLVLAKSLAVRDPRVLRQNESGQYSPLFSWRWPGDRMAETRNRDLERDSPGHFSPVVAAAMRALALVRREAAARGVAPHEDERLRLPEDFHPTAVRGIMYPANGKLHVHQDLRMGPVLSVSVGRSCEFFFGRAWEPDDESTRFVRLDSGDALFFNGQTLPHGVAYLHDDEDAVPQHWSGMKRRGVIEGRWDRFNLQMRDPKRMWIV